jgi:hypothetical protein
MSLPLQWLLVESRRLIPGVHVRIECKIQWTTRLPQSHRLYSGRDQTPMTIDLAALAQLCRVGSASIGSICVRKNDLIAGPKQGKAIYH